MPRWPRFWLLAALSVFLVAGPRQAAAGSDQQVVSSTTRLELAADGTALVRQVLSVEVRSGSFRALVLQGLDLDAQPLSGATVTRLAGPGTTTHPVPVQIAIDAGRVELSMRPKKGLRGRTFLLEFGYRTALLGQGSIQQLPDGRAELNWTGPRLDEGIDAVTLLLRLPAARLAPEAGDPSSENAQANPGNFGVVMSTLRRSEQTDELEIVRAHVARNEAPRWRVRFDGSVLGTAPRAAAAAATAPYPSVTPGRAQDVAWPAPPVAPRRSPGSLGAVWTVLAGLVYGLLVAYKGSLATRAALQRGCRARGWVPWRTSYRAAAAGLALAAATGVVLWLDTPWLAGAALVIAVSLAGLRPPLLEAPLRGPGHWDTLANTALDPRPSSPLPGAWLDLGRRRGGLLLMSALATITWCASALFETSPYFGACLLLGSAALLPLFCTGRAAEFPEPAPDGSRRFLRDVRRELIDDAELVVQPLGRIAAANGELDELRLGISPAPGLPGLIGMELGMELRRGLGGYEREPVLVVRAADGSPCQRALPRQLTWTRGRSSEERATLIRPTLPNVAVSVALIREVLVAMREPSAELALPERARAQPARAKLPAPSSPRPARRKVGARTVPV
jgi:hypothetical protein